VFFFKDSELFLFIAIFHVFYEIKVFSISITSLTTDTGALTINSDGDNVKAGFFPACSWPDWGLN
jgi:hypothetical protein